MTKGWNICFWVKNMEWQVFAQILLNTVNRRTFNNYGCKRCKTLILKKIESLYLRSVTSHTSSAFVPEIP